MKDYKPWFVEFSEQTFDNSDATLFNLEKSKTGEWTVSYKKKYLHSKYNPVKESQKITQSFNTGSAHNIIFFGLGLGYHILEILKHIPKNGRIFIIESSRWLVEKFIELQNVEILKDFEVYLISNPEDFVRFYVDDEYQIYDFKQAWIDNEFYYTIKHILSLMHASYKTKNKFKKIIIKNSLKNLQVLPSMTVYSIQQKKTNLSGIVVGAGPSLDSATLTQLYQIQSFAVIIASDTSYPLLMENNIIPDFVFSGDPQFINYKHFAISKKSNHTFLVSDISVHPYILKLFKNKFIYSDTGAPLTQLLASTLSLPFLHMGGSVTAGAFFFLVKLGLKSIYFVGQDFASTFDQSHCQHTLYDYVFYQKQNKFLTFSNLHNSLLGDSYQNVGSGLFTNQLLQTYKDWLIAEIAKLDDIKVYNGTENSLFVSNKIHYLSLDSIEKKEKKKSFIEKTIIQHTKSFHLSKFVGKYNFQKNDILNILIDIEKDDDTEKIKSNNYIFYVYDWFHSGELRYLNKEKFGKTQFDLFLNRVRKFYEDL